MLRDIVFILVGYLSGSVLYARIFGKLIAKTDITQNSPDKNPGTTNAFINGGFLCGTLTLVCDIMKGFIPVFLYFRGQTDSAAALVLAAPVVGHVYPIFSAFRGGKGIAVTFGCLLGYFTNYAVLVTLAFWYVLFVLVIKINTNYHKTFAAYIFSAVTAVLLFALHKIALTAMLGFFIIALTVISRLIKSEERKEPIRVKLLWMH